MDHKDERGAGIILGFLLIAVIVLAGYAFLRANRAKQAVVTDFESCVAAGNPIQESFPEVCRAKDGRSFTNPDQKAPAAP